VNPTDLDLDNLGLDLDLKGSPVVDCSATATSYDTCNVHPGDLAMTVAVGTRSDIVSARWGAPETP
jgi:hypothetical protein